MCVQTQYRRLLEGLLCLFALGASLVGFRIYFMGNKPPEFAPSDNPASDSDSALTRTLTYNYLPALNVWLLLFPYQLSFDWSMSAVPLVESVGDVRNAATVVCYVCLGYVALHVCRSLDLQRGSVAQGKPHANGNGVASAHSSPSISHSSRNSASPSAHRRTSSSSESASEWFPSSSRAPASVSLHVLIMAASVIVFPFIPASNLFFYVGFVIAERILYIPSMGFCLLVGQGVSLLAARGRTEWERRSVKAAVLAVMVLFAARTWQRNRDWQTEEKLYTAGIAVNPAKGQWGGREGEGRMSVGLRIDGCVCVCVCLCVRVCLCVCV